MSPGSALTLIRLSMRCSRRRMGTLPLGGCRVRSQPALNCRGQLRQWPVFSRSDAGRWPGPERYPGEEVAEVIAEQAVGSGADAQRSGCGPSAIDSLGA